MCQSKSIYTLWSKLTDAEGTDVSVSMGQLLKQAVAEESKIGQACKPYVEKKMMGKCF